MLRNVAVPKWRYFLFHLCSPCSVIICLKTKQHNFYTRGIIKRNEHNSGMMLCDTRDVICQFDKSLVPRPRQLRKTDVSGTRIRFTCSDLLGVCIIIINRHKQAVSYGTLRSNILKSDFRYLLVSGVSYCNRLDL